MAGETPAAEATPAADTGAATDLLDSAAADAGTPSADSAATAEAKPTESESAQAKADADGEKPKTADAAEADLLAENDEGNTPEKADGQADAKKDETPETYEAFTLPDGTALDEAKVAKATPLFKELGLPQDKAQKLVSLFADIQQAEAEASLAGFNQVKKDWRADIKADQEFGGDKLPQTLGAAKAVLGKFGDKALMNDLKEWGWSNHPGLIRLLARVNAHLSEDTLIHSDAAVQAAPKSAAEILWPSMFQDKE